MDRSISHEKWMDTPRPNPANGYVVLSQRACNQVNPLESQESGSSDGFGFELFVMNCALAYLIAFCETACTARDWSGNKTPRSALLSPIVTAFVSNRAGHTASRQPNEITPSLTVAKIRGLAISGNGR